MWELIQHDQIDLFGLKVTHPTIKKKLEDKIKREKNNRKEHLNLISYLA